MTHNGGQRGFSLLEIIVTIVIASLLGTALLQYLNSSLTRSSEPVVKVQQGYLLNRVVESITADYKKLLISDSDPLTTLQSNIQGGHVPQSDPYYGDYSAATEYIIFVDGLEAPDTSGTNHILKVTVSSGDASITALFTN